MLWTLFAFWLGGFIFVAPIVGGLVMLGGRNDNGEVPVGCLFALLWPISIPLWLIGAIEL